MGGVGGISAASGVGGVSGVSAAEKDGKCSKCRKCSKYRTCRTCSKCRKCRSGSGPYYAHCAYYAHTTGCYLGVDVVAEDRLVDCERVVLDGHAHLVRVRVGARVRF